MFFWYRHGQKEPGRAEIYIFSTGWRSKGTYVQQVAVEISFLTKDGRDVWSKLSIFLGSVIEEHRLRLLTVVSR